MIYEKRWEKREKGILKMPLKKLNDIFFVTYNEAKLLIDDIILTEVERIEEEERQRLALLKELEEQRIRDEERLKAEEQLVIREQQNLDNEGAPILSSEDLDEKDLSFKDFFMGTPLDFDTDDSTETTELPSPETSEQATDSTQEPTPKSDEATDSTQEPTPKSEEANTEEKVEEPVKIPRELTVREKFFKYHNFFKDFDFNAKVDERLTEREVLEELIDDILFQREKKFFDKENIVDAFPSVGVAETVEDKLLA